MARAATPEWRARVASVRAEFAEFCLEELDLPYTQSSLDDCLRFLLAVFNDQQRQLSARSIASMASALSAAREADGLSAIGGERKLARFLKAVRKQRPVGRQFSDAASIPFAPRTLLPFLPVGDSFEDVRLRALFSVRAVTMIRVSAPLSIRRTSIREARDFLDRPVVVFKYNSKGSTAAGVATDSNYVEFLPPDSPELIYCPARNLLRLRTMVEDMARSNGRPLPATVFVKADGTPLSSDRVSTLIGEVMRRAAVPPAFKPSSLRSLTNQLLQDLGVPAEDLAVRGGWTSAISQVRVHHYLHNRFVTHNFAELVLSTPRQVSGVARV